jgi:hypothetical protein
MAARTRAREVEARTRVRQAVQDPRVLLQPFSSQVKGYQIPFNTTVSNGESLYRDANVSLVSSPNVSFLVSSSSFELLR